MKKIKKIPSKKENGIYISGKESVLDFYNSLNTFEDINRLIEEGEVESDYLECKQVESPHLGRGIKRQLSETASAFANNKGGVILIGVETDPKEGADRLTQIAPVGAVEKLAREIKTSFPLICEPPVKFAVKTIKKEEADKKGIVAIYIYPTSSDPVMSALEKKFYLRIRGGDENMPYETIKRMFLGSKSPELWMELDPRLIQIKENNKWEIPITLKNLSTAIAKNTTVTVEIINFSFCEKLEFTGFIDQSDINPGSKIYITETLEKPIYKGLGSLIGEMFVTMKKEKRKLELLIKIYSENMIARYQIIKIYLYKRRFQIKELEKGYLY